MYLYHFSDNLIKMEIHMYILTDFEKSIAGLSISRHKWFCEYTTLSCYTKENKKKEKGKRALKQMQATHSNNNPSVPVLFKSKNKYTFWQKKNPQSNPA